MSLASLEDINVHLPPDKLEVTDAEESPFQTDAERIIKGYLSGIYTPITLASWVSPTTTPGLIRAIAGRLIAAFEYRRRYSEDSLDDPQYAQNKYNEAMMFINELRSGTIVLDGITGETGLSDLEFWPNDTTDGPYFTMAMEN